MSDMQAGFFKQAFNGSEEPEIPSDLKRMCPVTFTGELCEKVSLPADTSNKRKRAKVLYVL